MYNKIKNFLTLERLVYFSIIVFLIIYFKGIFQQTEKTVQNVEKVKTELLVDKNGNNHFRKPFQNNTSEIDKSEVDSLKKILEGKNVEIYSITKLNASIKDTLKIFKLEKDALNNKIWNFEKTFADGTKSKITMFEKDTTVIQDTDLRLYVTDYSEKVKGKRNFFVDVTSQNKNFKLNGSEILRIPVKEPKDLFQINWGSAYYKGIQNEMNFATSELKVWILPDNMIVPNIGAGGIWFLNEGKVYSYYKVGFDIRLKSVQK